MRRKHADGLVHCLGFRLAEGAAPSTFSIFGSLKKRGLILFPMLS
jgi:hypothetical protein